MKAIVVIGDASASTLSLQDVPAPIPGPKDLLVKVRAAGLNRTDLRRVQQHFTEGKMHIAGLEMAGEVIAVGTDVVGFAPGDRVMSQAAGCYAEQVCVDHRLALRVPSGLGWAAAAAVPVTFVTAHDALVTNGRLTDGCSTLIQAVTSGVGISAIQIARLMGASQVVGTTREPNKAAPLRDLGLEQIIDTGTEPQFSKRVLELTDGRGVDVVGDSVGAGALLENMKSTSLGGRIVSIGRLGGTSDSIDLDLLALRRISLIGVTFRSRSIEERQGVNARFMADMAAHLAEGRLVPLVDRTFPLDRAQEAQEHMRLNRHLGKIVLLT